MHALADGPHLLHPQGQRGAMGQPLQVFLYVWRIPRAGVWLFDRLTAMRFTLTGRRAELRHPMQQSLSPRLMRQQILVRWQMPNKTI